MKAFPLIPGADVPAGQQQSSAITLVPVDIVNQDGSTQTVYIQPPPCAGSSADKHAVVHKHLTTWYLGIGILALGIGIVVTIHSYNKK